MRPGPVTPAEIAERPIRAASEAWDGFNGDQYTPAETTIAGLSRSRMYDLLAEDASREGVLALRRKAAKATAGPFRG